MNTNFIVFGLIRPKIEPESTVSVADTLPTGTLIAYGHQLSEVESSRTSLALRPQVLENWPVLGSRTALFFELLKFCGALAKCFGKRFFVEIA